MPKGIASSRQILAACQRVTPQSVGRLIQHDQAVQAALDVMPSIVACTDSQGRPFYRVYSDYSGRNYIVARRPDGSWGCSATNSLVQRWAIAKVEAMLRASAQAIA